MLYKLALLLSAAALSAALDVEDQPFPEREDATNSTDFLKRCPVRMGGERRIDSLLKLMTCCNRPEDPGPDDFPGHVGWAWAELDLGRCFGNNDGRVVSQYLGNLQHTCSECNFIRDTTEMTCTCKNKAGEWVESEIEISDLLTVKEDSVVCCKEFDDVCGGLFDPDEWSVPTPEPAWDLGPY